MFEDWADEDPPSEDLDPPESEGGSCHFCTTFVGEDHYCFGCLVYICVDCGTAAFPPMGPHRPEDHLEEND